MRGSDIEPAAEPTVPSPTILSSAPPAQPAFPPLLCVFGNRCGGERDSPDRTEAPESRRCIRAFSARGMCNIKSSNTVLHGGDRFESDRRDGRSEKDVQIRKRSGSAAFAVHGPDRRRFRGRFLPQPVSARLSRYLP